jgi:signal transduction histidine kinase/CheY-like chemotaxis protein
VNDREVHRFARTLAEIAHTLEHVDHVRDRVERVLELTRSVVPYRRIALLDIDGAAQCLFAAPSAASDAADHLTASLVSAWRKIVDETEDGEASAALDQAPAAPPSLTLPVMGLDRINGVIRVDPPESFEYDATHLRLLSVVAAQLGAFLAMMRLRGEQVKHNAELATVVEFQQVLAAVVGHDLRSPLAVIITVATMLRETTLDPFHRQALDRAFHSAQRASRLISDLIDVTECRVQGAMPIRRQRADARQIIVNCVDEARLAHARRQIELVTSGDETAVFGHWDPDRLAQVLTNLINNAVHHGGAGTAIRVSLHCDARALAFAVHNSGPPIAEHTLPTIFDPFKRGTSSRAAGNHGLGLGLYIVDQIVRAHGGTIAVSSTAEAGTSFTVTLPRETELAGPSAPSDPALILVVDDDEDVRTAITGLLEHRGFRVASAVDGLDALEQLQRGLRPLVIVLDLNMPRMDGQAFHDRCMQDPALATIPILVVSADTAKALRLSGNRGHLTKPVQAAALLRALEDIGAGEAPE